ncbi:MAG TPA: DUF4386 family protein [Pyrinomonadaceae bacterium]
MTSDKRTGRIVGVFLVLQLAGIIVPFVLLRPLMTDDYLANAAGYSAQIKTAVLLFWLNCALMIAIAITAWPVFRRYSEPMAIWFIVLSVIVFVLQSVDNTHIMTMLTLSQQYVEGGGSGEISNALSTVVRTTRRWAHYPELFALDAWFILLYAIVLRFRLIPRAVAGFSLLTVALHFVGVPLSGFLGYGFNTSFGVPLVLGHLAMAGWLIGRGFADVNRDRKL